MLSANLPTTAGQPANQPPTTCPPPCNAVLLPHRPDVKLEHAEVSSDFLASFERREGLQQAVVYK